MMPSHTGPDCQKRGVILTCFVDGRKRFRAAPNPDGVQGDHLIGGVSQPNAGSTAIHRAAPGR